GARFRGGFSARPGVVSHHSAPIAFWCDSRARRLRGGTRSGDEYAAAFPPARGPRGGGGGGRRAGAGRGGIWGWRWAVGRWALGVGPWALGLGPWALGKCYVGGSMGQVMDVGAVLRMGNRARRDAGVDGRRARRLRG